MKLNLQFLVCLVLVCVVVALAGCAGGSARGPVTEASLAAPSQVAAALFVQHWCQILWGTVSSQTGGGPPVAGDVVFDPVTGTVSITFTWPDGTVGVLTQFPDGTLTLEITFPDNSTQTIRQGVQQYDGVSKTTTDWQITTSGGLSVNYTSVVDNRGTFTDMSDDTTDLNGVATLPQGLTQEFVVRTADGQTVVTSKQSDGSTFTMTVQLAPPLNAYPDMTRVSTGTYVLGSSMEFTLASTAANPTRWATMASDFGAGLLGQFALNADFSGSGELRRDGGFAGRLSWTRDGDMSLSLISAERALVNPAGAAVDFLTHRWQTLAALMSPAPG
jgi:hypothetical protein